MTSAQRPSGRLPARVLTAASLFAAVSLAALSAGPALAAPIERNLPPPPVTGEAPIAPPNALPADQDATPIGPPLTGLVVLTDPTGLAPSPGAGVDVSRAPRLAGDSAALARFIGRPLSRKLIAEVEAEIARRYRDTGHPFVNLTTPEQDVTSGVLQIRALEFRLGKEQVTGPAAPQADHLLDHIRLSHGDTIDSGRLAQDLDWLNRYPFRHVAAQFSPGADTGYTDLSLQSVTSKPWSVYAGYANSGSPASGEDRYFAGFQAAVPGLRDAFVSYQYTGSGDALFYGSSPFHAAPDPRYYSNAGRLVIPTLGRQDIEVTLNYVHSNQPVQAFLARQTILEASVAYRAALSDFAASIPGEAVIGIEAKRNTSHTLFTGVDIAHSAIEVFQFTVGYALQTDDRFGRTSGEVTLHVSPGDIGHDNTDAAFAAFSKVAGAKADYAYVAGDVTRFTNLPRLFGVRGFSLVNTLSGQYASASLPQTEQMGVGGASLVRGYTLDDGAFDTAVALRNELRTPSFSLLRRTGRFADSASPFVFVDAGYGRDNAAPHGSAGLVSTGLGLDYRLGAYLSASIDGAWALRSAGHTQAGGARLESRVTLTF